MVTYLRITATCFPTILLLGIATAKEEDQSQEVFLYLSEAAKDEANPVRNRLYKYQWDSDSMSLVNPKMLLDLPATPGPNHPGGKLAIGPDHYSYTVIGDLNKEGQLQNIKDGPEPDDSSVILRINPMDGSAAYDNPFVSTSGNTSNELELKSQTLF